MSADRSWRIEDRIRHGRMETSALGKWTIWWIIRYIFVFSYLVQVELFATDRVELSSSSGLVYLVS